MSRRDAMQKLGAIGLILAGLATGGLTLTVNMTVNIHEPPVPVEDLGWAGPVEVFASERLVGEMPEFRIVGDVADRDYTRENVRLWTWTRAVNNGKHLPNVRQQIGDCVSWGSANAVNYLSAVQIAREWKHERWRPAFPPYIYGTSRVLIGDGRLGCRSDGSVGSWAAEAVRRHGVLFADEAEVPEYSGDLASRWGCEGPPERFLRLAEAHPVATTSPMRSADDVMRAVCNGYPVTIASDFGTKTIREADGRQVAKHDGRWMHQMCVIAYDGSVPGKRYYYILNSWGPNAHGPPLQGEPPGGFWVEHDVIAYIVKQRDSFAYSGFRGFPAADTDFRIRTAMAN